TTWWWTVKTSCRTEAKSKRAVRPVVQRIRKGNSRKTETRHRLPRRHLRKTRRRHLRTKASANESVTAVHSAASSNNVVDGRDSACGFRSVQATADLGAAASGLPHDPGVDILSRRQSGRDDVVGYRPARAAVRPDSRLEPDDLNEFVWQLDHHAPVRARSQYRCGGAGSAGGHQRGVEPASDRSSEPANL